MNKGPHLRDSITRFIKKNSCIKGINAAEINAFEHTEIFLKISGHSTLYKIDCSLSSSIVKVITHLFH